MTKVLLDINVVLDVFLAREPWLRDSALVFQAIIAGKLSAYLSATSVPTIYYIVCRTSDRPKAFQVVRQCLILFEIMPVNQQVLEIALSLSGSDFEDNIQTATAILAGVDAIITRDPKGFAGSPIQAVSPSEFLARLQTTPDATS